MATLMLIRTLAKATPTTTAKFEVTASDTVEITAATTEEDLEITAETMISGRHQDKPIMMSHLELLRHLMKVRGMPMRKAAAAISVAVEEGEHYVLHL